MTDPSAPAADLPVNSPETDADAYRVLARKYRPANFAELVGQDALVHTLTNAIRRGRLAHAFLLTGVRGVGKTTTARIIARALNCIGADGKNDSPTAEPCGVCEHCRAIGADRHMDVLEMDAASRTGVDDIRELIESVRYRPTSARYKVYIVDEVHMLSRNAFNALLKTLEEPPEHVKFVFCTTETGKVPVTVLSRCQRFDLRRVEIAALMDHFAKIAEQEGASLTPEALALLARAADGSVRDGLSLLDQAISLAGQDADEGKDGTVDEAQVRAMLGLADSSVTFDVFDAVMKGDIGTALGIVTQQYESGADPVFVLEDLLELTHWLTRLKVAPAALDAPELSVAERTRGPEMAQALSMASLARAWQMLLKGLTEVRTAPKPLQALEMLLIRLAYAAELPSPAEAIEALEKGKTASAAAPATPASAAPAPASASASSSASPTEAPRPPAAQPQAQAQTQTKVMAQAVPAEQPVASAPAPAAESPRPSPQSFAAVLALIGEHREGTLLAHLENHVHLVRFEPGRIEFRPTDGAPSNLANRLSSFLNEHTGERWVVTVSREEGAPTVQQERDAADATARTEAAQDPLVQAVMERFPKAQIERVRKRLPTEPDSDAGLADPELSSEDETAD